MNGNIVDIGTRDGVCDIYVSSPDGPGPWPAVICFVDAYGIRPATCAMADRLAANGYFVVAPNPYYRVRRAPVFEAPNLMDPENMSELIELVRSLTPDRTVSDAGAYFDFIDAHPEIKSGRVGMTGYCMGGAHMLRAAAAYPDRVVAGASFHAGFLVSDDPRSPHNLLPKVKAKLYFAHADKDDLMTPEQIETFGQALSASGVDHDVEVFEGSLHGFTLSDLPMHDPVAAERHWDRLLNLFAATLKPTAA